MNSGATVEETEKKSQISTRENKRTTKSFVQMSLWLERQACVEYSGARHGD